jgi:SAM-dependent methyltransferase
MSMRVSEALAHALDVVVPVLDIAADRPRGPEPPAFCEARGYTDFLASLPDDELRRCEIEGLAKRLSVLADAPPSLVELGRSLLTVAQLPERVSKDEQVRMGKQHAVPQRKQNEIEALLAVVAPLAARADRVVDVGAGHGHFTRIAAEMFDREAVGIERVPERVTTATRLGEGTRARFLLLDATREALGLRAGDLAIGLHACGALGDRLILEAIKAQCNVVLVSCCLQKIATPIRLPSSQAANSAGLVLSKETLGLSNLTSRHQGVESTLGETMDARRKRWALTRLLRHRGITVKPGEEMRGMNRRFAHRSFQDLVQKALAFRGLTPASAVEVAEQDRCGTLEFDKIRRFSLPRSMLARPLEVTVAFDRATLLEERGYHVRVEEICDVDVTPRNLATIATITPYAAA